MSANPTGTFFNQARGFTIVNSTFTSNGREETYDGVLVRLKDAAASGISYDSVDRAWNPVLKSDERLASIIAFPNTTSNNGLLHFFHSIWPSDVQTYGIMAAKLCKDEHVLHTTIFIDRLLRFFPGQGRRRLVPTLAYQLAASPYAPKQLKEEILGALFLRPDIPQLNLTTQFEQLIIHPLRSVRRGLLPRIVFVFDSVHTIHYDGVMQVIQELVNAVEYLHRKGVDAKVVMTGVGYRSIIDMFPIADKDNQIITRIVPICLTNSYSLPSIARASCIPFVNWMYSRSQWTKDILGTCFMLNMLFSLVLTVGLLAFMMWMIENSVLRVLVVISLPSLWVGFSIWIEKSVLPFIWNFRFAPQA